MEPAPRTNSAVYSPPPDAGLAVLHVDDHLLVLDKPAGLLSVPGKGPELADCLESRARAGYAGARTIHRLDRDTSGVVVMALTAAAQRHLGLQFERRKLTKSYRAMVAGRVRADCGEISLPLRCDWPNRPLQMVCHVQGRAALTRWRVLARAAASTALELTPLTGRSHQLRLHLREAGHPVLGDPLYGDPASAPRLMLHAHRLNLRHPADGRWMSFKSALPWQARPAP